MKGLFSFFVLCAALAITYADFLPIPRPAQPGFPTFPGGTPPFNPYPGGTGPFNPRPDLPDTLFRLRRSPEDDKNKVTVNADQKGGQSSYNIDYQRQIFENQHGSVDANVGVNKNPGQKPQTQVGISGSFHW